MPERHATLDASEPIVRLLCGTLTATTETLLGAQVMRIIAGQEATQPGADRIRRDLPFVTVEEFLAGAEGPTCLRCNAEMKRIIEEHFET